MTSAGPRSRRPPSAAVDAVYHVGPTLHPREREMGIGLIDAARAEGVRHFVFSSVLHSIVTDLVQHEIKRDVEEHLVTSGSSSPSCSRRTTCCRSSSGRCSSAACSNCRGPWTGASPWWTWTTSPMWPRWCWPIRGRMPPPPTSSCRRAGTPRISWGTSSRRRWAAPIQVAEIDADTYLKAWVGERDISTVAHQARVLRAISAHYSSHDFVGNPNVLSWLLGRSPRSFADFVGRTHDDYLQRRGIWS